jgi:hypothetical protein
VLAELNIRDLVLAAEGGAWPQGLAEGFPQEPLKIDGCVKHLLISITVMREHG